MTHHPLKINRPVLAPAWTEQDMKTATTRIHNRFQGLLISVIESARWGNFHETPHPLEAHHPQWPDPGKYCDLILAKRDAEVVAALEVKTRYVKVEDISKPYDIMGQVLEGMGSRLLELQQAAKSADALWVVALGIYRAPPQSTTIHHSQPFSVFMVWGRDTGGMQTPMGRGFWSSLGELDRAMSGMVNPYDFFSVVSLPKHTKVTKHPSATLIDVSKPQTQRTEDESLEDIIKLTPMSKHIRLTLLAVLNWPNDATSMISHLKPYAQQGASASYLRDTIGKLARKGVIDGFKPNHQRQLLSINHERLISYLRQT